MRWLAGAMALLFFFAAAVQWNDPDPLVWMLLYGLAALLSILGATGRFFFLPSAAAACLFGGGFLWFAPSLVSADAAAFSTVAMTAAEHEIPREALGLAICAIWCAGLAIHARGAGKPRPDAGREC